MSPRLPPAPAIAACVRGVAPWEPKLSSESDMAPPPAAAAGVQHGQRRVEVLQHDFGRVFLDAVLVVVFAGLQLALDVNLRALLQILLGDLAEAFAEDHHAVPLGLFLALAGRLVAPAFRGGDPQVGDRAAVLGAPDFRIRAEICRSE
jgi:hypothetical protein